MYTVGWVYFGDVLGGTWEIAAMGDAPSTGPAGRQEGARILKTAQSRDTPSGANWKKAWGSFG